MPKATSPRPAASHRLPTTVRPTRYRLTLTPDLRKFTFAGSVAIEVEVAGATSTITLHASELAISTASLTTAGGKAIKAKRIAMNEKAETATLTLERPAPKGKAVLELAFTGTLNDQLRGFYRSQYAGPDGKPRYLATTQFEATDARRAFPCWDEPAVKATFEVTLVTPKDLAAISNMPIVSERAVAGEKRAVRFAETPRMSTYLLALIVGDLACVEGKAKDGTPVRVWTTRGKEWQGQFALQNSIKLLAYFNEYFGIKYALPKMDHIAIPDFAAGAMENWGAITYRETALLFDPKNSAAQARQRILEVVSHEMAHMWFGDLVTMAWWDDLWLNESFASWMGDKAVDHLYPEWNMWTQFIYQDTNAGLALDGLKNSHPIEQKVNDPSEIRELFDAISYSKGGATLRMIEEHLGEEAFRDGLRQYMTKHQYGNARGRDLWSALQRASGKPVTAIMNSWVKQTGFPVLEVQTRRAKGKTTVRLGQQRFLYDNILTKAKRPDKALWKAPVTIARGGSKNTTAVLLETRTTTAAAPAGRGTNDWVKVNAGQTGFYRANYSPLDWERLRAGVERLALPASDRLGLQDDAYALMRAGYIPATQFLSLARAYVNETDASVWGDFSTNLRGMENLLLDEPCLKQYQEFAGSLYAKAVKAVGWVAKKGEGHLDALLRSTVLGVKGSFGDAALTAEAQRRFAAYLKKPESLRPDVRGVVVGLVAQAGDKAMYETMWEQYKKADLQEEKNRYLGGLTRFQDKRLLETTLMRAIGPEVRVQDGVLVMGGVAGNQHGRDLAWSFMKENWKEIDRRYGSGGFAITRLVAVTGAFTSMERHEDVERFFKDNPTPSAARTIRQSLERIRLNAAWLKKNRAGVAKWLAAKK